MDDLIAIITAVAKSGYRGVRISDITIGIDCATDAQFTALVTALGATTRQVIVDDQTWERADAEFEPDGRSLFITGPHRAVKGEAA